MKPSEEHSGSSGFSSFQTGLAPVTDTAMPKARLLSLIHKLAAGMREATAAAAEIGPEWELIVEEVELTFCNSLAELESRLTGRVRHE